MEPDVTEIIDGKEVTEIHCHNCNGYIKFILDKSKNGNHVLNCPKCGHEHCRVVKNGVVTSDRFDSRNDNSLPQTQPGPTPTYVYQVNMAHWTITSAECCNQISDNDPYLKSAWLNVQDSSAIYECPVITYGNTTTLTTYTY